MSGLSTLALEKIKDRFFFSVSSLSWNHELRASKLLMWVPPTYFLCGFNYCNANLLKTPAIHEEIQCGIQQNNQHWQIDDRLLNHSVACYMHDYRYNDKRKITEQKQTINEEHRHQRFSAFRCVRGSFFLIVKLSDLHFSIDLGPMSLNNPEYFIIYRQR